MEFTYFNCLVPLFLCCVHLLDCIYFNAPIESSCSCLRSASILWPIVTKIPYMQVMATLKHWKNSKPLICWCAMLSQLHITICRSVWNGEQRDAADYCRFFCVCSQCRWRCVGDVAFCTCNEFNLSRVSLLQFCITAFQLKVQRDLTEVICGNSLLYVKENIQYEASLPRFKTWNEHPFFFLELWVLFHTQQVNCGSSA